jgi:hypothetical protein
MIKHLNNELIWRLPIIPYTYEALDCIITDDNRLNI